MSRLGPVWLLTTKQGGFQFDVGLSENSEYLTLGGPYNKDPTI